MVLCRLKNLFALVMTVMSLYSYSAQAESDDTNLLIVPEQDSLTTTSIDDSEIKIQFDPSEIQDPIKDFNRQRFIENSLARMNIPPSNDKVEIWSGPRNNEHLEKILELTDPEIALFLGKKEAVLNKLAKTLSFFKLPPQKINKALLEINKLFYDNSHIVSRSNTRGGTLSFVISAGLALPQKVIHALKQRSIGKFIPEKGGFYYLLGFGVSFARHIDENKKSKYVFEVFMDVERLNSTMTGIIRASTGLQYGLIFEKRDTNFTAQKFNVSTSGVTGILKQGHGHFGWNGSTGITMPPGLSVLLVYKSDSARYYLFRTENLKASLPALNLMKESFINYLKNLLGNKTKIISCNQAFI